MLNDWYYRELWAIFWVLGMTVRSCGWVSITFRCWMVNSVPVNMALIAMKCEWLIQSLSLPQRWWPTRNIRLIAPVTNLDLVVKDVSEHWFPENRRRVQKHWSGIKLHGFNVTDHLTKATDWIYLSGHVYSDKHCLMVLSKPIRLKHTKTRLLSFCQIWFLYSILILLSCLQFLSFIYL